MDSETKFAVIKCPNCGGNTIYTEQTAYPFSGGGAVRADRCHVCKHNMPIDEILKFWRERDYVSDWQKIEAI